MSENQTTQKQKLRRFGQNRPAILSIIMVLMTVLVVGRLYVLQIVKGDQYLAEFQSVKRIGVLGDKRVHDIPHQIEVRMSPPEWLFSREPAGLDSVRPLLPTADPDAYAEPRDKPLTRIEFGSN